MGAPWLHLMQLSMHADIHLLSTLLLLLALTCKRSALAFALHCRWLLC